MALIGSHFPNNQRIQHRDCLEAYDTSVTATKRRFTRVIEYGS
jgi:hypothetical protein